MIDRDNVMRCLAICSDEYGSKCKDCSYGCEKDRPCTDALMADALALLKQYEPRVMTLEEVKAFDWDYCYLEHDRMPEKQYKSVCGDTILSCITWAPIASMQIQYGDEQYGKRWRCWTNKPTHAQMKEMKWDGQGIVHQNTDRDS